MGFMGARTPAVRHLPVDGVHKLRAPQPRRKRQLESGREFLGPALDEARRVAALIRWAAALGEARPACGLGDLPCGFGYVLAGGRHAGCDEADVELDDGPYCYGVVARWVLWLES